MAWQIVHQVLVVLYIAAPVAALIADAVLAKRSSRTMPSMSLIVTICMGVILGAGLAILYSFAVHGGIRIGQLALAAYFATALLLILRFFDLGMQRALAMIFCINRPPEKPSFVFHIRATVASLVRVVVLIGVGLPYVMASVITYRPKVELMDNPQQRLGYDFKTVSFAATDGTMLSGWWIPAETSRGIPVISDKTVLICPGVASNKATQLVLARAFVPHGFNVLIFDFRGHGDSGGQLTSYGDLERRDVLGAVHYLKQFHPKDARHIDGVGSSMGAAALIAAAADPSPDGQAIDAIAAYGTYGSIHGEMEFVTQDRFLSPLRWLIDRFGLPLASAQVGTNLTTFSPATLVHDLWPRPILIIHGVDDRIISFEQGRRLFESAQQPKERLWIDHAGHYDLINDQHVAELVRQFFDHAHPVRII